MKRANLGAFILAWRNLMTGCEDGFSPLTLEVKEGYVDAVKDLVGLGADVNGPDEWLHSNSQSCSGEQCGCDKSTCCAGSCVISTPPLKMTLLLSL